MVVQKLGLELAVAKTWANKGVHILVSDWSSKISVDCPKSTASEADKISLHNPKKAAKNLYKTKRKNKLSTAMDSQHRTVASPPSSQGRDSIAILFTFLSFFAVVALVTLPLSSLRFHNIFNLCLHFRFSISDNGSLYCTSTANVV